MKVIISAFFLPRSLYFSEHQAHPGPYFAFTVIDAYSPQLKPKEAIVQS